MRTLGAVGSVASVIGTIVAVAVIPGLGAWLYPLPLIVVLVLALVTSWMFFLISRRGPGQADQERLNRLLSTLPRQAIRRVREEDFSSAWDDDLTYPVTKYLYEHESVEDRFDNRALERRRKHLYEVADKFVHAEGANGFSHRTAHGSRYTGWAGMELEEDSEKCKTAEKRRVAIRSPAVEFVKAHDDLVSAAKHRRFKLEALAHETPRPTWREQPSHA